jgi:aminomethyltransferase
MNDMTTRSMTVTRPDQRRYRTAREGTAFVSLERAVLRGRGADRLDLINRLSTNSTLGLNPAEETTTILTSEKGRLIEVIRIVAMDDHILMVLLGTDARKVQAWLDKYTIMDDFTVDDASADYAAIGLHGDRARDVVAQLTDGIVPDSGQVAKVDFNDGQLIVMRDARLSGMGAFLLLISRSRRDSLVERLVALGVAEMDRQTYETLRVEAGIPTIGAELTDRYNPLEAGLVQYVSFTKGCYIGQEVIARLDSYDKVQRHLLGLVFDEGVDLPSPEGDETQLRVHDSQEGRPIGTVTSVVYSPSLGRTIGLSYIRTQFANPGMAVKVGNNGDAVGAILTKLPFAI